jgi:hypothetical protein
MILRVKYIVDIDLAIAKPKSGPQVGTRQFKFLGKSFGGSEKSSGRGVHPLGSFGACVCR